LEQQGADRSADNSLIGVLGILEKWTRSWTSRFSPRFYDPEVVKSGDKRIREILADPSPSEIDVEAELEKISSNSGRIRLVDYPDTKGFATEAIRCLRAGKSGSLKIQVLRPSFKDDTKLNLVIQKNDSDGLRIELDVFSFAAIENYKYRRTLEERLGVLAKIGFAPHSPDDVSDAEGSEPLARRPLIRSILLLSALLAIYWLLN